MVDEQPDDVPPVPRAVDPSPIEPPTAASEPATPALAFGSADAAARSWPTAWVSIVLLALAGLLTLPALWVSLWGGYGGSAGTAIGWWVAVLLLCSAAGALSLAAPSKRGSTRRALTIATGGAVLCIAPFEALVLLMNLSGGHLRVPLAIILALLITLGALFIYLGLRRPTQRQG